MSDDSERHAERLYPNMKEQIERERAYYEALGRFVDAFAQMETAMALALWKMARVPKEIARSVFSGVRAVEAGNQCRRIMEAVGISEQDQAAFKTLTDQLGVLNGARNDLIHYGAQSKGSTQAYVTNALKAHLEKKITTFAVSPEILDQMRADAVKIVMHLHYEWNGREWPKGALAQAALQHILQSPWRYTHQPQAGGPTEDKGRKPPKEHPR